MAEGVNFHSKPCNEGLSAMFLSSAINTDVLPILGIIYAKITQCSANLSLYGQLTLGFSLKFELDRQPPNSKEPFVTF